MTTPRADGKRFAVVASRWNEFIVDKLVAGAVEALGQAGAKVDVFRCPGAFELPGLSRRLAETGRFQGIVALGTVLRGDTAHFDIVANESARGMGALAAEARVAVGFGVLACDTIEQALDRAGGKTGNRGADAALVAVEMANLYAAISR